MKPALAVIGLLALATPALGGNKSADGAWTGTAVLFDFLDRKQEAVLTLSRVGDIGSFDIRLSAHAGATCRYVFRAGTGPKIVLQARVTTALESHCAKRPGLSFDPTLGALQLDLNGRTARIVLHQRFEAPGEDVPKAGDAFDVLGLAPGLDGAAAEATLSEGGYERQGARVLSDAGWREEHVTYARISGDGQQDQIQIIYSPEIEGEANARRIVYLQRLWQMVGQHTISDIERSVSGKYGLSLLRVGNDFAQDRHTTRAGDEIDLADWKAGCASTTLQQIPFVKAFAAQSETELISTSCGRALAIAARPVSPQSGKIASFFISLLDVQQIWRAAWTKWRVTTKRDIKAALDEVERDGKPVKL